MGFLMDVAVGVVTEIGKYVLKPIGHQLGYLVFYNRNKNELKEKLENLETTKRDVQRRVEEARSNANEIHEEVSKWLVDADNAIIHDDLSNSNPSCFNLLHRHQISRKTKKKVTYILELINKRNNFVEVGYPAPLPDTENTIIPEGYQVLESKLSMAKQIKDALANPDVNKVGVYGMGGVGKTYLLNEVKKLVIKDKLFDRVIDVTVGQSNGIMEMQQQIGDILNIELPRSKEGKASFLRNKLVEMKGNILLMFDDLWKEYDLIKEVGIPLDKEGCKVLMTSRDQNILTNYMINRNDCFQVTCLNEEESWKFFRTIVGDKFDTTYMEIIAKEVVRECGGLPLALDTIAKALKEKQINYWEDALSKLKKSIAVDIKGVTHKVYASLRLSYDYLDGDEAKVLFLLCTVFPDDYMISTKDLQVYAMSMRLLKRVNTWGEARNSVIKLVDDLTSSSLLQVQVYKDISYCEYVKMHDIIRDVAIYIASTTNMSTLNYGRHNHGEWPDEDKCGSYRAIFVDCENVCNLLPNMKFPKLELLILRFSTKPLKVSIETVDAVFEGMENLKVLELTNMHVPSILWTSLKKLRALCLSECECKDIDKINHLKELEILRVISCEGITELPTTMSELKYLRVLVVSQCSNLVVIPPNIISNLTKLEELNIQECFEEWGEKVRYKNEWIQNARLLEMNCLPQLSILKLQISKADTDLEDLSSKTLKKLREFFICVGAMNHYKFELSKKHSNKYEKTFFFNMELQTSSVNGMVFDILLDGTEQLKIVHDSIGFANVIFKPNINDYPLLKCLMIDGNSEMSHLNGNYFTSLEWLYLSEMMLLESIVPKHALTNPFSKLTGIQIKCCEQMRNLFSISIFKGLLNLQEIEVIYCDMMDEIVFVEIEHQETNCTSPLTSLHLDMVNKVTSFCTKPFIQQHQPTIIPFFDQQVCFPEMKNLSIHEANNMEMLWHNDGPTAGSFCKLQSISIRDCNKLKCIFPWNIVTSLALLDTLSIFSCELLEKVFEIEMSTLGDTKMVALRNIVLNGLPSLKYMWNKDAGDVLTFPNLKEVLVTDCPKMKSIFPASFPKYVEEIEKLTVDEQNEIFPVNEASESGEVVLFGNLRSLTMSCKLATNQRFWLISKFLKLKNITLVGYEDDKLISLPLEMSEVLYNIEELKIETCFQLVYIFGNETEHDNIQRCANLKKLELKNLPKLAQVWKNNMNRMTTSTFFNFVDLEVECCNGMTSLFSSCVAKNLVNLERIKVYNCIGLTTIVAAEEEEEEEENDEIVLNKLTSLEFDDLPRLTCFHSGKCILKFPRLNNLYIYRCYDMKAFSYGTTNAPTLEFIRIGGSTISVLPTRGINAIIQQLSPQQMELIPGMSSLNLRLETVKRGSWRKPESFTELNTLRLIGSEDDDIVCLPMEIIDVSYNFETFEIQNACQLVHVFENGELSRKNHVQRRAKLKQLHLWDLPKLTQVWKESIEEMNTIRFDSLERMSVRRCENLKCILSSSITFLNLKSLEVDNCNGMLSLFSPSVVKNLGNLKHLDVSDCREMTSIVSSEDEEEEDGEIVFEKLYFFRVHNLPRLACAFYAAKCMLKFPSLNILVIVKCNEMKTFSVGIVSTPRLHSVRIGKTYFEISPERDINVIIQHIFAQPNRMEESEESCED